jgi:D-inositol-3-phosphate glycosyltransferase
VVVGGDGANSPEFQAMVQKSRDLKIDKQVIFAGQTDQHDLPPYYGAADALVLPSRYESFGMVALEALACGRPVVSTSVGAVDSLIRQSILEYSWTNIASAVIAEYEKAISLQLFEDDERVAARACL